MTNISSTLPFAPKQLEFIINSTARWNIAHGSVRSGKTIGTLFRFMQACEECPDSDLYMVGFTSKTLHRNVIKLLFEDPKMAIYKPFCTWSGGTKNEIKFRDKTIVALGAKDEGAVGMFQGLTASKIYCDEMTLYPQSVIEMINSRLSRAHSQGFAAMNPGHPSHIIKQWIDKGEAGEMDCYSQHFTVEDNPYLPPSYAEDLRKSSTGIFYKRNYLGLWCLAEGAIFDFFDRAVYVKSKPPRAAEYWIAGIDVGFSNNFACVIIGISTGQYDQTGVCRWIEAEYVWDSKKQERQKTVSEYADDVQEFLAPYGIRSIYVDPSALAFKIEARKRGLCVVDADNDVEEGIKMMTSEMKKGNIFVLQGCSNTIREIESYVWDPKAAEKGEDAPLKKDDHCFDGETLVSTGRGLKKIKDILPGDSVLTRQGFQRVIKRHCKWGYLNEYLVHGIKISCTSDHRIYTLNREWIEIDDLLESDILIISKPPSTWENQKQKRSFGMGSDTDVIRNLLITMTDDTITEQDTIFIEMCGNSTMDLYQPDTIYITKTEIPVIIAFPISNVSQETCISSCIKTICDQIDLQINVERPPRNGTDQSMEGAGIRNMQNVAISERMIQKLSTATNVTTHSKPPLPWMLDFVQITVNRNGEERLKLTMSWQIVSHVLSHLQKINIPNLNSVTNHVPKCFIGKTRKRVYDLSVANCHEYFANGILVHNCVDAMRYAIYTHKVPTYQPYKKTENIDYMNNRFEMGKRKFG